MTKSLQIWNVREKSVPKAKETIRVFANMPNSVGLENIYFEVDIIMKPTNSPTQGQPNPRKSGLKSGNWATFFPPQIIFAWVGIGFIWETDYK